MRVSLPLDNNRLLGRECLKEECHHRYFKMRLEGSISEEKGELNFTGDTENFTPVFDEISSANVTSPTNDLADNLPKPITSHDPDNLYCPYCGYKGLQDTFATKEQKKYATSVAFRQLTEDFQQHLQMAERRPDPHAFLSIGIEVHPGALPEIATYQEENLRQNVTCPHCEITYAVYGLSFYCPRYGQGTILQHLEQSALEIEQVLKLPDHLKDVLKPRGYQRLIENALEDVISLWEGYLKAIYRHNIRQYFSPTQVERLEQTVGTTFQRIDGAVERYRRDLNVDLLAPLDSHQIDFLKEQFQKRHILTHNLGLADERFLAQAGKNIRVGQEILVDDQDTLRSLHIVMQVLRNLSQN